MLRILDLFSCAGGAGMGYAQAGLHPYGVELDAKRAMRYPFAVHVGDAIRALATLITGGRLKFVKPEGRRPVKDTRGRIVDVDGVVEWLTLADFIAAHASPPCQAYTRGNAVRRDTQTKWPRLIEPTREHLQHLGIPYVIENVKDAGEFLVNPTMLCGCMFDLSTIDDDGERIHLQRPRLFETSFPLEAPRACDHRAHQWVAGAYGGARRDKHEAKYVRKGGYVPPNKAVVMRLLGIRHPMTWIELFESIPPAYTAYIGRTMVR